ncbi:sigma-54 dependent transcriptional regulator [Thermodesulfovibrionales bacterium]|nr:sigma-54 dependent transcriptional regulator [Thermodesulfovibrionales bacterium]MCL0030374.1 sigma-54 dependent transcriptional regulator [Thermodesulfovibrionales bacterium]MCL0040183.1 sigma-54 dependent transcriptional regulator [Thermodesulfovibrionales bacterium]MCL0040807.1 sigma-54 dependent transcriptional regulator [Thermodesulfovibrionales bacterium]MCL0066978.1 sigma-54 dependent transcriptional regulator [Thermodesulfovibrionales bacterium]
MANNTTRNDKIPTIIGSSEAIKRIHGLIKKASNSVSTVLIGGESGTGKELVAKAIHYSSNRTDKPFVAVNCGAIPTELLESELFGHERGAFTGAITSRIGRFELANKGTIFFDEIGEMRPMLQIKLLRVLQERAFERIGGTKTITVDVRVIAATNRNLEDEIKAGRFREDLFYRFNVIPINIPPLRERTEDIPILCSYFIEKHTKRLRRDPISITDEVLRIFTSYRWSGNVRELENTIERLLVLKDDDVVTPYDLPERMTGTKIFNMPDTAGDSTNPFVGSIDLESALKEYEKRLILYALELNNRVKSRTAKHLNINRTTLIVKMKRLGIM